MLFLHKTELIQIILQKLKSSISLLSFKYQFIKFNEIDKIDIEFIMKMDLVHDSNFESFYEMGIVTCYNVFVRPFQQFYEAVVIMSIYFAHVLAYIFGWQRMLMYDYLKCWYGI